MARLTSAQWLCKACPPERANRTDETPLSKAKKAAPDLEKSMTELENIVQQLEDGDIPLEQALQQFEKGVKLSRDCQQALDTAEQRVKILMKDELQDFDSDDAAE
jgi:exodeoxyribonuclease VII small subunit